MSKDTVEAQTSAAITYPPVSAEALVAPDIVDEIFAEQVAWNAKAARVLQHTVVAALIAGTAFVLGWAVSL